MVEHPLVYTRVLLLVVRCLLLVQVTDHFPSLFVIDTINSMCSYRPLTCLSSDNLGIWNKRYKPKPWKVYFGGSKSLGLNRETFYSEGSTATVQLGQSQHNITYLRVSKQRVSSLFTSKHCWDLSTTPMSQNA